MVRGVNKTVIEVNCTEHGVFERALLFVKPGVDRAGRTLEQDADEYVSMMALGFEETPKQKSAAARIVWAAAKVLLAAAAGITIGALLL